MTTQFGGADEQRHKGRTDRRRQVAEPRPAAGLQLVCDALLRLLQLAARSLVGLLAGLGRASQCALESERVQRSAADRATAANESHVGTPPGRRSRWRIPPVQMSQEIVAGFEEQQVAHELSARVVEEALQAIIERLEMAPVCELAQQDQSGQTGQGEQVAEGRAGGRASPDSSPDGSLAISLAGSSDEDDPDEHCGRQASQLNLRQLRLSALEDVLVCDRRRHKTSAARDLFNQLAASSSSGDQRAKAAACKRLAGASQRASSLSSRSSCGALDTNSDEDNNSAGSNPIHIDYFDELLGRGSSQADDCGTIKLDRRCCSSSSSSSVNFGRTLVCSVSPTGQFNLGASNNSNNNSSNNHNNNNQQQHKTLNIHEPGDGLNQGRADPDLNYPINGDEIRQCRAAFRENRRRIEQAQMEACRTPQTGASGGLSRSASQATERGQIVAAPDRSRWAESLGRRSRLPDCSRCQQRLYPIDKLDLDFARATLNIHRNCFKCQVCATLLRLETYASIDAKLYCPAHVKCVAPSR